MTELKNVTFSYDNKQVLKDFSLTVNEGERVCIFGKSGIGKSTLVRLITGLEKQGSGEINNTFDMSVLFQEDRLLPFKTVYGNIKMFSKKSDAQIDSVLTALDIIDCKDSYPSQLSGGMSRRASLARTLLIDADLYIFDEPFASLDGSNTKLAIDLINTCTKDKAVVLITHDKNDAVALGCKIIDME